MSTLYERIAGTPDGEKRLAVARLRREALRALYVALEASGLSQSELAARLRIRKSAVNQTLRGDGNLRIKTIAEYLLALGYELDLRLVQAGEPRRAMVEDRDVTPASPGHSAEPSSEPPRGTRTAGEQSIHVVDTGRAHLLVNMTLQAATGTAGQFRFEGDVHVVPKREAPPLPVTAPSAFKPLKPEVSR